MTASRGLLFTPFWIRWLIGTGAQTSSIRVDQDDADRITDTIFKGIHLPHLSKIIASRSSTTSDATILQIAAGCSHLHSIEILSCPQLTLKSLATIGQHCRLLISPDIGKKHQDQRQGNKSCGDGMRQSTVD